MRQSALAMAVLASLASATAAAQGTTDTTDTTGTTTTTPTTDAVPVATAAAGAPEELQLTLPAGKAFVQLFVEMNLSKDSAFEPVSIAPDIYYGVSDDLTLGLVHSSRGTTGLFGGVGQGLCITGEDGGCPKVYDNVGLAARYHLWRSGGLTLAADGGLFGLALDPFSLALKLGVAGRFQSGALSVELAPNVFIGLTERDGGNKETLFVPATFMYGVLPQLGIAAQLGLVLPFSNTDAYMFGASIGAQFFATDKIILNAVFSLPALAGGSAILVDGVDVRTFTLGAAYAF